MVNGCEAWFYRHIALKQGWKMALFRKDVFFGKCHWLALMAGDCRVQIAD
jgi:hypothetical protein